MAQRVVDLLEAIEIDEKEGHRGAVTARDMDSLLQTILEKDAVGQAGEGIMERAVLELGMRQSQLQAHAVHAPREIGELARALNDNCTVEIPTADGVGGAAKSGEGAHDGTHGQPADEQSGQ